MPKNRKNIYSEPHRGESNPTAERIMRSDGNFDIGDDKQGRRIYVFRDSALERLKARKSITDDQFAALDKYRSHWYLAGMAGNLSSVDLDRIFSTDPAGRSGMPTGERQAYHRGEYRRAVNAIGLRDAGIVENVVCHDYGLEVAGKACGWSHPMQQRAAALEILRSAAVRLECLWNL